MEPAMQLTLEPEASQPALPPACPLAALPEGVLEDILLRSGLRARQVCRAFRSLHPPLRSLTPHDIRIPEELAAALASLPRSLTSLDLRYICGGAITPAALAPMYTTVPPLQLQRLTVPCMSSSVLSSILNALHRLIHLHTLHVLDYEPFGHNGPPSEVPWATLLQAPMATRLRALGLPISALPTILAAPSRTFPQLTTITFVHEENWKESIAGGLTASLLGPVPSLRRLTIAADDCRPALAAADHVTTLTTLTALSWHLHIDTAPVPAIGTLTGLRCLRLFADLYQNMHPSVIDSGWLRHLILLTQLKLVYQIEPPDDDIPDGINAPQPLLDERLPVPARIISDLVQAVVALPQLQALRLHLYSCHTGRCDLDWLTCGTEASFFSHLATATQLRCLRLHSLPLPPMEVCLLSRLQGLTQLRLKACQVLQADTAPAAAAQPQQDGAAAAAHGGPAAGGLQWLAALTGLRELCIRNCTVPHLLQAVATLPHLHTLVLHKMWCTTNTAAHLLEVLDRLQGVLVRLDLDMGWDTVRRQDVFHALGSMTHLRTLSLEATVEVPSYWYCLLMLPASLTQCYLPPFSSRHSFVDHVALHRLRAWYPWVSFKPHGVPHADEWLTGWCPLWD